MAYAENESSSGTGQMHARIQTLLPDPERTLRPTATTRKPPSAPALTPIHAQRPADARATITAGIVAGKRMPRPLAATRTAA